MMRAVDEPITLMHEAHNEMSRAVWVKKPQEKPSG